MQKLLWFGGDFPDCPADEIDLDPAFQTGLRDGSQVLVVLRECQRAPRLGRKIRTDFEALEIDRVQKDANSFGRDSALVKQEVSHGFVNRNIPSYVWQVWRHTVPTAEIMSKEHGRRVRKARYRRSSDGIVMPMDQVYLPRDRPDVIGDRDAPRTDLVSDWSKIACIYNGAVTMFL